MRVRTRRFRTMEQTTKLILPSRVPVGFHPLVANRDKSLLGQPLIGHSGLRRQRLGQVRVRPPREDDIPLRSRRPRKDRLAEEHQDRTGDLPADHRAVPGRHRRRCRVHVLLVLARACISALSCQTRSSVVWANAGRQACHAAKLHVRWKRKREKK